MWPNNKSRWNKYTTIEYELTCDIPFWIENAAGSEVNFGADTDCGVGLLNETNVKKNNYNIVFESLRRLVYEKRKRKLPGYMV